MPVGIRLDFSDFSLDDYDRTCQALDFPARWPDGLLAHAALEVAETELHSFHVRG